MFLKSVIKNIFKPSFFLIILVMGCLALSGCDLNVTYDPVTSQEEMDSVKGCWTCQIYTAIFNTGAVTAARTYDAVREISLSLLALGLFAWLIIHTLKLFMSMRVPNLAAFWVAIFGRLTRGGFIAILLSSSSRLYELINTIIEPIVSIFVNTSFMILNLNFTSSKVAASTSVGSTFASGPGLPASIGTQIEDLIYRITVALNIGRAIGLRMMVATDATGMLFGFILICFFFLMIVFFPLYIIDALIRFVFIMILLPIFLIAWVFPITQNYIKTAWDQFIGAFAQLMISCIFVALVVSTIEAFTQLRGYNIILNPTYQNTNPDVLREMTRFSVSGFSFLVLAYYMYALSKKINGISGFLSGAPGHSTFSKAIDSIKNAAKALALVTVAIAASAVGAAPVATAAKKQAAAEAKKAINSQKAGEQP